LIDNLIAKTGMKKHEAFEHTAVRDFYEHVYHKDAAPESKVSPHYRRLAKRYRPWQEKKLLDIACGTGGWLRAAAEFGAEPTGIDISPTAIEACRRSLPNAVLHCGIAEQLPFDNAQFDFVSCLGALEHFLNPGAALREMIRVAKHDATFLLLVPNADFLTQRLGLYSGTQQVAVHEEALSLRSWQNLFESVGLSVKWRWKDLHVLSASWVFRGPWFGWPLRAVQAFMLPFWPLSWQYQVYHHCTLKK
jgi:SAM-dependent methyltransferase